MSQVDMDRFFELFHQPDSHRSADEKMALSNLFALGCYLHMQGQVKAGRKACRSALNAMGRSNRETFMNQIMGSLEGNEVLYASRANPHTEINQLFLLFQSESESRPE